MNLMQILLSFFFILLFIINIVAFMVWVYHTAPNELTINKTIEGVVMSIVLTFLVPFSLVFWAIVWQDVTGNPPFMWLRKITVDSELWNRPLFRKKD